MPSKSRSLNLFEVFVVLLTMVCTHVGSAQSAERKPIYLHPVSVSSSLRQVVDALGDRLHEKGKERVSLVGTIDRNGLSAPITVVKESPGFLRIDLGGPAPKTIVDNLDALVTSRAKEDDDVILAELFGSDSAEGFLQGMAGGGSLRKIGDSFVVAGVKGFGAQADIYDLYAPSTARDGKPHVQRQYLFDSETGLLSRVRYSTERSSQVIPVQVVLSDYQLISGYSFPGKVIRLEGEKVTHTFMLQGGSVLPKGSNDSFKLVR
jgi:hypothetical protein